MNQLLTGQTALITGGNAGIGKAIALLFAKSGANIAIFGTNEERGLNTVHEIQESFKVKAHFYSVDVSNTFAVDCAIKNALSTFGNIEILVNNAGITRDQLLMKMTEEDWDLVINTNLKSCFNTCHALMRHMLKTKKGKIINISSVIGLTGNAGQVNYAASKSGIIGFTKSLAKETASRNITVNCIAPGFIETNMTNVLSDSQRNDILSKIPMGRMGRSEEIANAALFLASPLADYITGQVLTVDGGMVM